MNNYPMLRIIALTISIGALIALAGCNLPKAETSLPTEINVTQAYQTVQARLTEMAALTPTQPPFTATPSLAATLTPSMPPTPATPLISPTPPKASTPVPSCDLIAPGNPIDVTIPDDTVLQPNQAFTKIWRLQNAGTCTWTRNYSVVFFSGEQMGAPVSQPLAGEVAPGQTVDIAVDMVAPSAPGKYQGNWKLRNASNVLFGLGPNGSAPFWVRIVVAVTPTRTTTTTVTPTATTPPVNTPTATPVTVVSGNVNLSLNDGVDLDTAQVNSGGIDLAHQLDPGGQHLLAPQNNAIIGVYGTTQPSRENCMTAPMTSMPIILENTPAVSYLCYRTDQGLPGFARLVSFSPDSNDVTLDILTWALP